MDIKESLSIVKENIDNAAKKSGRKFDDINLIAVSKVQPIEKILELKNLGVTEFGENKVQELLQKYNQIDNVKWHMIGHLQRNKVKYIIDKVKMIQSLDTIELAEEINKRCSKNDIVMPVLVEINIGKEESKSGIYEEDVIKFVDDLTKFNNLKLSGIMTVAPKSDNNLDVRYYFSKMKKIYDEIKALNYECFDIKYLSMGMTNDYISAIEEGSNMVRVGTGIFGKRIYKEEI